LPLAAYNLRCGAIEAALMQPALQIGAFTGK
jgi:hypothetical protein